MNENNLKHSSDPQIPAALVKDLQDRKVIPFVGAGFSRACGYPGWSQLLKSIVEGFKDEHGLSTEEILRLGNNDPLRIAEFLFILKDRRIGPLRRAIESEFSKADVDVLKSDIHINLVNLNAPLIYTTNYDDLIERAHRAMEVPFQKIVLVKDFIPRKKDAVEIVKFHGDLEHEETLVLTESGYYKRLSLETSLDIRFRSDILGRTVLFMGYGFADINIRVIWFRLREMMREVRRRDIPRSYMVTVDSNPVSQALLEDVGIETLVLKADNTLDDQNARYRKAYADFMHALVDQATYSDSDLWERAIQRFLPFRPFVPPSFLESLEKILRLLQSGTVRPSETQGIIDDLSELFERCRSFRLRGEMGKRASLTLSMLLFLPGYLQVKRNLFSLVYDLYVFESHYRLPLFETMALAIHRYDFAWEEDRGGRYDPTWFIRDKMVGAFDNYPPALFTQLVEDSRRWIEQEERDICQRKTITFFEFLKECTISGRIGDREGVRREVSELIGRYVAKVEVLRDWEHMVEAGLENAIYHGGFPPNEESDDFDWTAPGSMLDLVYGDAGNPYFPPKETVD